MEERQNTHSDVSSKPVFKDGCALKLVGQDVVLRIVPTDRKKASIKLDGNTLNIQTPTDEEARVRRLVIMWYRYAAKHLIPERVRELNAKIGFEYKMIIVRDQRSRWGSCSRKRTLSFNWRLLLAPPLVMDYIILHELAHLKEMNHSTRFWQVVGQLCPTYRDAERWLKKHGRSVFW